MELVKLKMKNTYKSFLILLALLIILSLVTGALYLFRDKIENIGADIEVIGPLSINFLDGKDILVEKEEKIRISVTNSDTKPHYYNINFLKIRGEGTYKLLDEDTVIMTGELKSTDEIDTNYIMINESETKIYELIITNSLETPLKGVINLRSQDIVNTFADIILKNTPATEETLTKVGVEVALEDEGLIKSNDDIGTSYYYRGNVQDNYVLFGNLLWRIVRINGDGTVRLVLNDVTDNVSNYYKGSDFEYNSSVINEYLNIWLEDNLREYLNYIATSKYCSDISHDDAFNYYAYTRIYTNKIPSLNCLGTTITSDIGLMSIDEVILAGATPNNINQNYYLYNKNINDNWYTMTGARGNGTNLYMFMIDVNGSLKTDVLGSLYRGVRPVINLVKNIEMVGKGTIDDPYRLD